MKRYLVYCISVFVLMSACSKERPPCEFAEGQFVRSKLSMEIGQVTFRWRGDPRRGSNCYYTVRFVGRQEYTDTHAFNNDGPIKVVGLTTLDGMKAYELEAVGD